MKINSAEIVLGGLQTHFPSDFSPDDPASAIATIATRTREEWETADRERNTAAIIATAALGRLNLPLPDIDGPERAQDFAARLASQDLGYLGMTLVAGLLARSWAECKAEAEDAGRTDVLRALQADAVGDAMTRLSERMARINYADDDRSRFATEVWSTVLEPCNMERGLLRIVRGSLLLDAYFRNTPGLQAMREALGQARAIIAFCFRMANGRILEIPLRVPLPEGYAVEKQSGPELRALPEVKQMVSPLLRDPTKAGRYAIDLQSLGYELGAEHRQPVALVINPSEWAA
ncbi:MAG: hypothetical protein H7840_16355 [Alphaproteobacteria bacterium]